MRLSGITKYNKQEGTLSVSEDIQSLEWTPRVPGAAPVMTLPVATITNLQQSKAKDAKGNPNPKVMLKVVATASGVSDSVDHIFHFTTPGNNRAEADAIRDALARKIEAAKVAQSEAATLAGGTSAALAIASAISSGADSSKRRWEDDESLKSDGALQQSLLKTNSALQKTFLEARKNKPESITLSQFTSRFWAPRVHLLRAHALDKDQALGSYNVLSKIDPRATTLSLSAEQIHLIFSQYPSVQRIYNKEVPNPLDEASFWSHFFKSKLFKKLRGLQISNEDATDKHFDKYLNDDETAKLRLHGNVHVPHIIDVEGNEENHSQRKGNRPDEFMRPTNAKLPLFRSLNALSEQLMSHVTPIDTDPSEPIGMDEATYNELRLRDLQDGPDQARLKLNIQDPSLKASLKVTSTSSHRRDPKVAIHSLRSEMGGKRPGRAFDGSDREHFTRATSHIFEAIRQRRLQTGLTKEPNPLPTEMLSVVEITHATTNEFLSQFWHAFLSGDPERALEVAALKETLEKSTARIKAVADRAEEGRTEAIETQKQNLQKMLKRYEGTKKKKARLNYDLIQGGADIVNQLLASTRKAVDTAVEKYELAARVEEQQY